MENLHEILKKSEYNLYKVFRRHCYMYLPHSIRIDCGQYTVEEIPCCNEEDYNKIIRDFAGTLSDDENALLTCNQIRAYLYMCDRNRQLNEAIDEEEFNIYFELKKENDKETTDFFEEFNNDYKFESSVFEKCEQYTKISSSSKEDI